MKYIYNFLLLCLTVVTCNGDDLKKSFLQTIDKSEFSCVIEQIGATRNFLSIVKGNAKDFEYLKQIQKHSESENNDRKYLLIIMSKNPNDFIIYSIKNESIRFGLGREDVISVKDLVSIDVSKWDGQSNSPKDNTPLEIEGK